MVAMMHPNERIERTRQAMEAFFNDETSGHDWAHVERVWKNAQLIVQHAPSVNREHIELAALLHDRYDRKLVPDQAAAKAWVRNWLHTLGLNALQVEAILYTIDAVSYQEGKNPIQPQTLEDKIVQDADRLDAIGAIGIARTFAFSGAHHRPIYSGEPIPEARGTFLPSMHPDTAIAHFYEKLLLIADNLHTPEAQAIASKRHAFMEAFLAQFYAEWNGER